MLCFLSILHHQCYITALYTSVSSLCCHYSMAMLIVSFCPQSPTAVCCPVFQYGPQNSGFYSYRYKCPNAITAPGSVHQWVQYNYRWYSCTTAVSSISARWSVHQCHPQYYSTVYYWLIRNTISHTDTELLYKNILHTRSQVSSSYIDNPHYIIIRA